MATTYRQDMPPKGGFGDITWKRISVSKIFGWKGWAFLVGFHAVNGYIFMKHRAYYKEMEWVKKDARTALLPVLMAESDRVKLRRAKHNEEAEAAIMADEPGWVPGASVMHDSHFVEHLEHKRRDWAKLYPYRSAFKRYHEEVWELPIADIL
eukprot:scpid94440/ scgid9706/ NADH dehydrogenase [ubiquinone] 1 alpha subcomplex subunit 13; Cell death regulatory protein GRIM-19; Complex I-B16.6; Gene associated with retinoic and interferon-induced mortality 19 protein; NADH-ubiquinone oxidoreductase B16.6 subunit